MDIDDSVITVFGKQEGEQKTVTILAITDGLPTKSDNVAYMEELCIEYVCKAKLTGTMRKVIKYFDEQKLWQPLSKHYAAAEITIPLPKWSKARRFVFIRETQKAKVPGGGMARVQQAL